MKLPRLVALLIAWPLATFATVTSQVDKTGPFLITSLPATIPAGFPFISGSDLLVLDVGPTSAPNDPAQVLTLGSDYTVTGGNYNTANQMQLGSVVVVTSGIHAVQVNDLIVIMRNAPINQTSSFTQTGPLTLALIEQALDKQATLSQQVNEIAGRSLQFEDFESINPILSLNLRKGALLGFTSDQGIPQYIPYSGTVPSIGDSTLVTATGTTQARTLDNRFADTVNLLDFGAVIGQDCTTAMQAAVNSGAGKILLPGGEIILGPVAITRGLTIQGQAGYFEGNSGSTYIVPRSATETIFYVNGEQPVVFRDINFTGLPQTAGYAVEFDFTAAASVANLFSLLDNVTFDGMFNAVYFKAASSWTVNACKFWNINGGSGVIVSNTFNTDQGDGNITGCTFSTATTGAGVTWQGGGDGLRVVNNKFILSNPLNFNFTGVNGGQIYINGNSFDNIGTGAGFFTLSGTATFGSLIVTDNAFFGYGATTQLLKIAGVAGSHITDVTLSGNKFAQSGGSVSGALIVVDYVDRINISGGQLYTTLGSGTGISIGSNCTGVQISADIQVLGFSVPYAIASANSNLGTTALSAGSATVANTSVTANSRINLTLKTVGGSIASQPYVATITPGTGFTVAGGGGSNTSTYNYEIRY